MYIIMMLIIVSLDVFLSELILGIAFNQYLKLTWGDFTLHNMRESGTGPKLLLC